MATDWDWFIGDVGRDARGAHGAEEINVSNGLKIMSSVAVHDRRVHAHVAEAGWVVGVPQVGAPVLGRRARDLPAAAPTASTVLVPVFSVRSTQDAVGAQ